jgi:hypothetical protein
MGNQVEEDQGRGSMVYLGGGPYWLYEVEVPPIGLGVYVMDGEGPGCCTCTGEWGVQVPVVP